MVSFPEHGFVVLLATSAGVAAGVADGDVTGVLHGVPVSAGAALLTAVSVGTGVAEATALLVDVELAEVDVGAAHRETCSALQRAAFPCTLQLTQAEVSEPLTAGGPRIALPQEACLEWRMSKLQPWWVQPWELQRPLWLSEAALWCWAQLLRSLALWQWEEL